MRKLLKFDQEVHPRLKERHVLKEEQSRQKARREKKGVPLLFGDLPDDDAPSLHDQGREEGFF